MSKVKGKKASPMRLKVTIDDVVIFENVSTDTFVKSIEHIGIEKISELTDVQIEGLPLVVKQTDYRMQMRPLVGGWYVCTHLSTMAKQRMLEKISNKLGLEMRIEVI